MGRRVGPALAILAASASLRWALAEGERPLVVTWSAPEGCPAQDRVEARVDELLGGPPRAGAPKLTADGRVQVVGEGNERRYALRLELTREGHASSRKLESSSCQTVSETAALVIALAFDPDAVQAASTKPKDPPAVPSASAPPVASSAPPVASSASPAPSASAPPATSTAPPIAIPPTVPWAPPRAPDPPRAGVDLGFTAGVDFLADYGSLPGLSAGFRVRAGLSIDAFRVEPLFVAWPSATATLARDATVGADFTLFAGGLRVCRRVLPWRSRATSIVWLTGCIDGEAGQIAATGFGVDKAISATALWGAAGAELEARLAPPGPIGLVAGLGFVVPFDPRPFVVETPARDVVFTSSPASLRFGAGLDGHF